MSAACNIFTGYRLHKRNCTVTGAGNVPSHFLTLHFALLQRKGSFYLTHYNSISSSDTLYHWNKTFQRHKLKTSTCCLHTDQ